MKKVTKAKAKTPQPTADLEDVIDEYEDDGFEVPEVEPMQCPEPDVDEEVPEPAVPLEPSDGGLRAQAVVEAAVLCFQGRGCVYNVSGGYYELDREPGDALKNAVAALALEGK